MSFWRSTTYTLAMSSLAVLGVGGAMGLAWLVWISQRDFWPGAVMGLWACVLNLAAAESLRPAIKKGLKLL